MIINMVNVGFGDCFVLTYEKDVLIIDCGTKNLRDDQFRTIVADLKQNYLDASAKNFERHALITHFHEDHFKGFEILNETENNIFDTIYIPYLYQVDSNNRPILLELVIFCYTFFKQRTFCYNISSRILKHIGIVVNLAKDFNVICLSTGDIFPFGDRDFEVIWPDKAFEYNKSLTPFLNLMNDAIPELKDYEKIKDNIINNMKKWYEICSNKDINIEERGRQIKEIVKRQEDYLVELDKYKMGNSFKIIDKDIFKLFKDYGRIPFLKDINSTSIVFHDKIWSKEENEIAATVEQNFSIKRKRILMSGDVTKKVIDTYLLKRFMTTYDIVKVPHHGTNSHFTTNIPIPKEYFISTGYKDNYGKITANYGTHSYEYTERVCTSGAQQCEMVSSNGVCRKSNCTNIPIFQEEI